MKIYLDTCSIQRPLDSKTQLRIALEAEAVLGIIVLCEAGRLELISSEALRFEVKRTPSPMRRQHAEQVLSKAAMVIVTDDKLEARAKALVAEGIKPLDALHLASAETAQADYFCTCDDRLLKRARAIMDLAVKVVSPAQLIEELDDDR